MRTAYKFRMYPNRQQEALLGETLETCRHLYNTALADRKNSYEIEGIKRSYEDQAAILTAERRSNPYMKGIYAHILQDVLRRLDKAFKAFFRRVKAGEKPGYPRFKGVGRYHSFTYPDAETGYKIEGSKLTLSKIGSIRIFKHREIEGRIKTCTLKRDSVGHWFVVLVAEIEDAEPIEADTSRAIGIDLGLSQQVTTSEGETFGYPEYFRRMEKKLAKAQRSLSRKKKGSRNRQKARVKVAKIHLRITDLRRDYLHKLSHALVDRYDIIVFEDLNIKGMVKNRHLAKSIQDHSWGSLIQMTLSKAEKAGKRIVLVDPRNTSQRCSGCGVLVPKDLSERVHTCPECGIILDRDHNAALNILTLGLRGIAFRGSASAPIGVSRAVEEGSSGL